MTYLSLGERFWSKVNVGREDECWEWQAGKNSGGYGDFSMGRNKRHLKAHHVSYFLFYGVWPQTSGVAGDKTVSVIHSCDNRACVNPHHLSVSTHEENMRQMVERGRSLRGEKNPTSKLTELQVEDIRRAREGGAKLKDLSAKHGVAESTICRVAKGRAWAWK